MMNFEQFETCMNGIKNSVARVNRLEALLKQTNALIYELQCENFDAEPYAEEFDSYFDNLKMLSEFLRWKVCEAKKEIDAYYLDMAHEVFNV